MIDATGMAVNSGRILAVAASVNVFPGSGSGASHPVDPSVIGVIRDQSGAVTLVKTPRLVGAIGDVQAVSDGARGWHILLVDGHQGGPESPFVYDSATIWYGHFDGTTWSRFEQTARVRSAILSSRFASNLVVTGDGVAFAFPFDRSAAEGTSEQPLRGLVLLQQTSTGWSTDTLLTWASPRSVQLISRGSSGLLAVYSARYFAERRPHGPALHIATYSSRWGPAHMAFDPSPEYTGEIISPASEATSGVVTWRQAQPGVDRERLVWTVVSDTTVNRASTLTGIGPTGRPAVVGLADGRTLWLVRERDDLEALTVLVSRNGEATRAGVIPIPLRNFVTRAVEMHDGTIVVLTGGADTVTGAVPPYASYLTELSVRCPPAPQTLE